MLWKGLDHEEEEEPITIGAAGGPQYVAVRLQSVDALEQKLNELRSQGFVIKHVMCGLETYTVVALLPEL